MKTIIKILIAFSLLFFQILQAQETDMAKVTLVRKNVKVIVGNETKIPQMDDEFPLNAKIKCDKMGLLEFQYKGNTYRIKNQSEILLSDAIQTQTGDKNISIGLKTDPAGVRGLDKSKNTKKHKAGKKQKEE